MIKLFSLERLSKYWLVIWTNSDYIQDISYGA